MPSEEGATTAVEAILFQTAGEFLSATRAFLETDPATNQLILNNALRLAASENRSDALMAAVFSGANPVLAAIMTPPHLLVLSHADAEPPELKGFAALLAESVCQHDLPGVLGPREQTGAFGAAYSACRGIRYRLADEMGIHRLTRVIPAKECPGRLRQALEDDIGWLTDCREGFCAEIGHPSAREEVIETVCKNVASGSLFLWEDAQPVSTALFKQPVGKGISIGGVYTPPEYRRRGYASACVAALSQLLLDRGYTYCTLYTNLANPTSNHIYRTIGYEPVCEVVELKFDRLAAV